MSPIKPTWPAIIKYDGDDELIYVESSGNWRVDTALYAYPCQSSVILIDTLGEVFELAYDYRRELVSIDAVCMKISMARFSELVQNHLLAHENTSANMTFSNYQQGFKLIASTYH